MSASPPPIEYRRPDFHDLMRFRIWDVLLVSRPYDSFVLEEAGQLAERMLGEFRNLDVHYAPGLTNVATGAQALALARTQSRFNLVISALKLQDMNGVELARRLRAEGLDVPVVLLAFDMRELSDFAARNALEEVERVFLWQGDARILMAIVKIIEDARNVEHDTASIGVQSILLVEDNVRYYSSFLPEIYSELLRHSQRVIADGVNLSEKITRMRARPKILHARNYEEAWDLFTRYSDDLLGVVSDMEFPRQGQWTPDAGLELARGVRKRWPDVPVLLQSSRPENEALAREAGFDFLLKGSPVLLKRLRRFMLANFGFGDFVFRLPDGREVGRARDLHDLELQLQTVPAESVLFHAGRNHFSNWLKAHTEFDLAEVLRPRKLSDFTGVEDMRRALIDSLAAHRRERSRTVVADFDRASIETGGDFQRIGGGSLGGKARGLAFMRLLLAESDLVSAFPAVRVVVPPAVVLGTDVFDQFLDENELRDFALQEPDDERIAGRFEEARLPETIRADLRAYLEQVTCPLAVRSSSLLEDSQYQAFTGVYETFMLRNNQGLLEERLKELTGAVKRVYASTFSRRTKDYIRATPHRLEEEKMAVIVQQIVGLPHGSRFYPDFAGVARSHNFYPTPPLLASDGVAAVAIGLGRTVVEGGNCVRFSPRHPKTPLPTTGPRDALRQAQRVFWGLELDGGENDALRETCFDLEIAEADGVLGPLASTYSRENNSLHIGTSRPGVRLPTFGSVLQHDVFPLAPLLTRLLETAEWGLGTAVEIEFAVNLARGSTAAEFGFLQLRPLALSSETEQLEIGEVDPGKVLCRSTVVLGNGRIEDLEDLVVVDVQGFERGRSRDTASALGRLNAQLRSEGRSYLLIGVGRWGSADPWLGIPVSWDQISGARVIVEAGFDDVRVTPSQGTHFFQNLTTFNVGYFTVNPDVGEGALDWDWLRAQPALNAEPGPRRVRLDRPLLVLMNGHKGEGVILKP